MDINIGLLGFGILGRAQALAWRSIPFLYPGQPHRIRLAGVYESDASRARAGLEEGAFAWSTSDAEELISHPEINLISVAVSASERPEPLRSAMAAGKHIFCDILLAPDVREAEEISALSSRVGGVKQLAGPWRYVPAIARAKAMIEAGEIGAPYRFTARSARGVSPETPDAGFRGGVLEDLGVPVLDLARWLIGEVTDVCGTLSEAEAESLASAMLRFGNDCEGLIDLCRVMTGRRDKLQIEVVGTAGALHLDLCRPEEVKQMDADGGWRTVASPSEVPPTEASGWLAWRAASQFAFLNAIAGGTAPHPTFRDGLMAHRIVDAIYRSDAGNAWQPVDLGR